MLNGGMTEVQELETTKIQYILMYALQYGAQYVSSQPWRPAVIQENLGAFEKLAAI